MPRQKKLNQEFVDSFALRLRRSLSDLDMSGRETAKQMGVSPESVRRWIKGISMPDSHDLALLCEKFGMSSDFLLLGNETKNEAPEDATAQTDSEGGRDSGLENKVKEQKSIQEAAKEFKMVSEDELKNSLETIIKDKQINLDDNRKAFNVLMGEMMKKFRGRADGALISKIVKERVQ